MMRWAGHEAPAERTWVDDVVGGIVIAGVLVAVGATAISALAAEPAPERSPAAATYQHLDYCEVWP